MATEASSRGIIETQNQILVANICVGGMKSDCDPLDAAAGTDVTFCLDWYNSLKKPFLWSPPLPHQKTTNTNTTSF